MQTAVAFQHLDMLSVVYNLNCIVQQCWHPWQSTYPQAPVLLRSNQSSIGKQLDGKMSLKLRQRAENAFAKVPLNAPLLPLMPAGC